MMARKGGLGLLMAAATASAMTDQPKINQARKKRLAPVEDPDLLCFAPPFLRPPSV